jgi:Predicted hydrolases or acyltransferases (alpha/beta hydrolase superfamily)
MPSNQTSKLECLEKNAVVNGLRLTYFERGMAHRGTSPTLLFVHATGFHARVWDKIINGLGNIHSISVDQRGHGRSEKKKIEHWENVISDVHELIVQLDLRNVIAIGHSMGAHALLGSAARSEDRFLKVIAIDPVIPAEEAFTADIESPFESAEEHPTAKRRNEFDSPAEMAERLSTKGSFGLFDPEVMQDYCRYGLLPNEKGKGYVLACPPEIEASVYMSSRSNHGIYDAIRAMNVPVLILRAKEPAPDRNIMDFSSSPTWPQLVNEFKQGREIHFSELTHFLPMQIPDEITQIISDEIEESTNQQTAGASA